MQDLELEEQSRDLVVPCEKGGGKIEEEERLDPKGDAKLRGLTARLNYLGQDRSDIQYAVKKLCKRMAKPTIGARKKLKKVVRYLKCAQVRVEAFVPGEARSIEWLG